MTVAGTTPYVAWTEHATGHLTVWRPNASGTQWVQVGGRLNHSPGNATSTRVGIAADGATPWVTWTEADAATGKGQVRVARLVDGSFQEVGGGAQPANLPGTDGSYTPQIAIFNGRPYIAFAEGSSSGEPTRVVRVSADGDSFERVTAGLSSSESATTRLAVAGGRLYLSHYAGGPEQSLDRLNSAGTAWENLMVHTNDVRVMEGHAGALHLAFFAGDEVWRWTGGSAFEPVGSAPFEDAAVSAIASAGGRLYAAGRTTTTSPDIPGLPRFASYDGSAWQPLPPPSDPGVFVGRVSLAPAADGAVWMLYTATGSQSPFPPFTVHVARYGERAATPPPGHGGAQVPPPAGGFTDPDGRPAPVVPSRPEGRPGACANPIRGTRGKDRIVGSVLGEGISGRAGDDFLFAGRGRDCTWGGADSDFVGGGRGSDALAGGRGTDRLAPGPGRDDVAAGPGNDRVFAVGGGVDRVNCGRGRDTVHLSRNDLIKHCERVIVHR